MPTQYQQLTRVFKNLGVKFSEVDERKLETPPPFNGAVKYVSVDVAHFHFDEKENYLGIECNGDGKDVKAI